MSLEKNYVENGRSESIPLIVKPKNRAIYVAPTHNTKMHSVEVEAMGVDGQKYITTRSASLEQQDYSKEALNITVNRCDVVAVLEGEDPRPLNGYVFLHPVLMKKKALSYEYEELYGYRCVYGHDGKGHYRNEISNHIRPAEQRIDPGTIYVFGPDDVLPLSGVSAYQDYNNIFYAQAHNALGTRPETEGIFTPEPKKHLRPE